MHTRHRYPLILVDKIIELEPEKRVLAIKNVTLGEVIYSGHFPTDPILPGIYTVEGLCQSAQILVGKEKGITAKLDQFKFLQAIRPGDQITYDVSLESLVANFYTFKAQAFVEGKLVCKGKITGHFEDE
jgi:3-hydroxyacyl-[acyl-carrier-protein] dehydratase